MEEVLRRMETIRHLFIDTKSFCELNYDLNAIKNYLENIPPLFRSIAYESASMSIAVKSFEANNSLENWHPFSDGIAKNHRAQVYIGLGWAIAKQNLLFGAIVSKFDNALQCYVADGCGYYDGSFRQRQTILSQQLPVYLAVTLLPLYDQGVGRSLWYTYNADVDRIKNKVETFSAGRQPLLWKGIGIAVAYMGGCDDKLLKDIFESAGGCTVQLAEGAALAVKSRAEANATTNDTEHCARLWTALGTI